MAKDTLRSTNEDQMRPGTITGSAAKGYAEHSCDGSDFNKWGNRIEYAKLAATSFK